MPNIGVCVYVCMYVCMCMYVYIYIYMIIFGSAAAETLQTLTSALKCTTEKACKDTGIYEQTLLFCEPLHEQ